MSKTHYLLNTHIIPIVLTGILLGGQSALACGKGKLLFQDKFQTLDPRWQLTAPDQDRSIDAGVLSYALQPEHLVVAINQAGIYEDYELCAQIAMKQDETSDAYAGLVFWAANSQNRYIFMITARDGTYAVSRVQKNKVLAQIPWGKPTEEIKKGGGMNELSVAVQGDHAVFSVNGQKVAELDGQPPDGGSQIGFEIFTPKKDQGATVFGIKGLEVRALQ
jgi:hypothetical protein